MKILANVLLAFATFLLAGILEARQLGLYPPDMPASNNLTKARIALGRALFLETALSKSGTLSCASCHQPAHAFSDPKPFSHADGEPVHRRNATSIVNVGYRRSIGWEGQSRTLEHQVINSFGPYGDMGISLGDAVTRVSNRQHYIRGCKSAYGTAVDAACITRAIAAFERSLTSAGSRFDRFLFGGDQNALSKQEKLGWTIFSGQGACIDCHDVFHASVNPLGGAYATFSDERFHNLGVGYHDGVMSDPGRYEATRDPEDFGAFKTPMLRNVSKTGPFMHDGSLPTLDDVVDFYNRGGNDNPTRSPGIKPLYLTRQERDALVAFLKSLDSDIPTQIARGK